MFIPNSRAQLSFPLQGGSAELPALLGSGAPSPGASSQGSCAVQSPSWHLRGKVLPRRLGTVLPVLCAAGWTPVPSPLVKFNSQSPACALNPKAVNANEIAKTPTTPQEVSRVRRSHFF